MRKNRALHREAAEVFFGDLTTRPDPQAVARLIGKGLTEQVVLSAARSKKLAFPIMSLALREHAGVVPFVQQISDQLAQTNPQSTMLFAARDAEMLYDDFAIRYAQHRSYLMPASSDLWESKGMKNDRLAGRFLGKYGLTAAAVSSADTFVVVDSGIFGSIGVKINKRIEELHELSLRKAGRLCVKLVSKASSKTEATQIMDFEGGKERFGADVLPRTAPMIAKEMAAEPGWSANTGLMVALQIMPRYQATFDDLKEINGEVVAVPSSDESPTNDNIDYIGRSMWAMNKSVVNPAAAAVFQYRTVNAAPGCCWRASVILASRVNRGML